VSERLPLLLHEPVKPGDHFPQRVLHRLAGCVAVGFVRQNHQAHRAAVAAHGLVHAFGLNRESAGIVVGLRLGSEMRGQSPYSSYPKEIRAPRFPDAVTTRRHAYPAPAARAKARSV